MKKENVQLIASLVLVAITAYYAVTSHMVVSLMQKTNRGDLRPYLFIKLLSQPNQPYFSYKGNSRGILFYTLNNNGKVTANNIIRSYKVYKIDKSNEISITRPTYVNIDYVFSLPPQEPLEGQPDIIDGINFKESDINNNYYIIELWVSYEGAQGINETSYYSSIGIEVHPSECSQGGNWNYRLYIKHRGEGVDQNLKEFWQWHNSDKPLNIQKKKQLETIYLKKEITPMDWKADLVWLCLAVLFSAFWGVYGIREDKNGTGKNWEKEFKIKRIKIKDIWIKQAGIFLSEFIGSLAGWLCLYVLIVRFRIPNVTFGSFDVFLVIVAVVGITGYSYRIVDSIDKLINKIKQ